jgi:hypothetical protein
MGNGKAKDQSDKDQLAFGDAAHAYNNRGAVVATRL